MQDPHPLYGDLPDSFEERLRGASRRGGPSPTPSCTNTPAPPLSAEKEAPYCWPLSIAYFVSFLVISHYLLEEIPEFVAAYRDVKIQLLPNAHVLTRWEYTHESLGSMQPAAEGLPGRPIDGTQARGGQRHDQHAESDPFPAAAAHHD